MIAHQDIILDRLLASLQQGSTPEVVVAGEQQCGLHENWKELLTKRHMQERDARELATHIISTRAFFLPEGLVQEAMPQLVKVKKQFKDRGGRCGAQRVAASSFETAFTMPMGPAGQLRTNAANRVMKMPASGTRWLRIIVINSTGCYKGTIATAKLASSTDGAGQLHAWGKHSGATACMQALPAHVSCGCKAQSMSPTLCLAVRLLHSLNSTCLMVLLVLLFCDCSLHAQICTATCRLSTVLAVLAAIDPKLKVFTLEDIQLIDTGVMVPGMPGEEELRGLQARVRQQVAGWAGVAKQCAGGMCHHR
jgi:hypothetical protein